MSTNFLVSTNPAQGYRTIGQVAISSESDIKNVVSLARNASTKWRKISVAERVDYIEILYTAFEHKSDLITKMACSEMGMPIKEQRIYDFEDGLKYFKWYLQNAVRHLSPEVNFETAGEIHTLYREPFGITAVLQPWNYPFCSFVWSVIPNLLSGNTVIFKHSEECPLTGKIIEDIIKETDLPEGVFSEIYGGGDVGELLLNEEINLISFTGSYKTGKKIYSKASEKLIKVILELGGSAPGIVFSDVSIDEVAETIFAQRFSNNGQICDGLKRLIIHQDVSKAIIDKLVEMISSKVIGDPLDEETDFGSLVADRQLELLESQVSDSIDKGAKAVIGGKQPANLDGAFYEPTILTNVTREMRVWNEEVFGPVLPIMTFKTIDEAIELGNDTEYGLGGYVFSSNIDQAEEVAKGLNTGMVSINGVNYLDPRNPFGGYKHSGIGREHGYFGFHDLTQVKVIAKNK